MDHLHPALGDDHLIIMLLYDNDLFHDKKQSEYTNVYCKIHKKIQKNFLKQILLIIKKIPLGPFAFFT